MITTASPPPIYVADFETGDLTQILGRQEATPDRITTTTNGPLQGTYSAVVKAGPGDYFAGNIRSELFFGTLASMFGGGSLEGKETWVTWEQRLGASFEIAKWCVITQFHGGYGSPVFAIEVNGDQPRGLVAVVRGGGINANYRYHVLAHRVPLKTPLRFKVYHRWSVGSGGVVKVWLNGALKARIDGPNLIPGYEAEVIHKGGIYRADWGVTKESQLLIDDVRWWSADPGSDTRRPPASARG